MSSLLSMCHVAKTFSINCYPPYSLPLKVYASKSVKRTPRKQMFPPQQSGMSAGPDLGSEKKPHLILSHMETDEGSVAHLSYSPP